MAFDYRNLRVFISSRMEELAEERRAVKEALGGLLIATFAFEQDAGARETSIEETFVEELAHADLYVGLFWKGYGEYTIEEYHKASNLSIPRLVYEKRLDLNGRDPNLQKFLNELGNISSGITIRWFDSPADLRANVKEDVAKWLAEVVRRNRKRERSNAESGVEVELLPCLCDRIPQEDKLRTEVVSHAQAKQRRPILIVLNGHKQEAHRLYIDRIERRSLLESLRLAQVHGRRKMVRINEPIHGTLSQADFSKKFRMSLANRLKVQYSRDDQFLLSFMRKERFRTLISVFSVLASEYASMGGNPLEKTCEHLAQLPDLPEGVLLGVIVCLEYEGQAPGTDADRALENELQCCRQKYADDLRLRFIDLPTLASVTPADVMRWLDDDDVKLRVPFVPRRRIDDMFDKHESLPMENLYEKLLGLVQERASA